MPLPLTPLPQTPGRAAKLSRTVPLSTRARSRAIWAPADVASVAARTMRKRPSRTVDMALWLFENVLDGLHGAGLVRLTEPEQRTLAELGTRVPLGDLDELVQCRGLVSLGIDEHQ